MLAEKHKQTEEITVDQYLKEELTSEIRHEFIDGQVYAMAGASANHERLSGNMYAELRSHLFHQPCEPFGSDMKVKIGENFYYPDVLVDCNFDESTPYFTDKPIIIVEVLSKSTRKIDKTTKKMMYFNIPSLQEYLIIEQDYCEIEVFRRSDHWKSTVYLLGNEIHFESINLTLSVEDIYHRVNNEDMIEFLATKNK